MEMKIESDKFYILETGEEKWIHDTEESAVQSLKRKVSKSKDLNPKDVCIIEVNTTGEKWKIQEVPWSKIAIKVIRGEE